ncbi:YfiR/HmsC family protein [Labilibacter marinus]|uniref:YfiR/HmsC family protein n=1 Tax=Labilibacter marinus TaxID=1477105 RepID=UPI001301849E|nr:YfiR/HmsC family protein [Labilibacter marinus]
MVLLMCFLSGKAFSQVNSDELKGAIVLHLCENIEWPKYDENEFKIGFLTDDRAVFKVLKSIESTIKIHGKKVKLIEADSFDRLLNCHAVYFNKYELSNINQVFDKARLNNILLITDDFEDALKVHVNLMQEGARMAFDINMANLTLAKLEVMPNILLNGGSVVDIKTAFEEFDDKLEDGRAKLRASENELKRKEKLLEEKNLMIAQKEVVMKQHRLQIDSLSEESKKQADLSQQQKEALQDKEKQIDAKNLRLEAIYQDIEEKQDDLDQLKNSIATLSSEANLLKGQVDQKNQVLVEKEEYIKSQRRLLWLFISMLSGIALTAFAVFRLFYIKRKLSIKLQNANNELKDAIEELNTKNEIINRQNIELSEALDHLKGTQDQLLQAEKMASLGILTDGIAHEINNPLNFILGGFLILKEYFKNADVSDDSEIKVAIKSIDQGVSRATSIVRGLNALSSSKDDFNESCSIHEIIDNCLIVINNNLKGNITIVKSYQEGLPEIKGNSSKLHQAFLNVLSNAAQALSENGEIEISTQYIKDRITVVVSDDGCGISEENLAKVADPFFSTKAPGEGTGLGLSITYNIIQEHGGKLNIESKQGSYTAVTINIPVD